MLRRSGYGVLVAFAVAVLPVCRAQDPPSGQKSRLTQLSLEQLGDIEVTSVSKEPARLSKTAAAIYVLTGEDIRRSGVTSIPEALRLVPGVEVARIDGNKWSIGIRGFGSRFSRGVLVLIDGRNVYTTLLSGTYWEVQNTVLDDIDRIEVIRGPGGSIWGPNAVNGVINIITKSAKDTHGELVSTGGGTVDQGFGNFRYGGTNGKGFDYRVYGMGFTQGPLSHPDGRNFDDWRNAQGGFRMDYAKSRDSFTVQGDIYREEAGESVTATSYTPPYSQIVDANAHLSGGNILGRWKRTFANGSDMQVQMYYDRTNRHEPNFGEIRDTFDIDFLHHLHWGPRQDIIWGLGARWSDGNAEAVVSGLTFTPSDSVDKLYTAFLQDEIQLAPGKVALTLGSKLLHNNYNGLDLEPSIRLAWTPTARQTLWAAANHAVRTPSRIEEDFNLSGYLGVTNGFNIFGRFEPNKAFASEQSNGLEFGYRQLITPKIHVDISTFYNHYHDLFSQELNGTFQLETSPGTPHVLLPVQFRNGVLGATTGGEVSADWRPLGWWRVQGSYDYLHIDLKHNAASIDASTAPSTEGGSPQHQAVVQSFFNLPKHLEFSQTLRYVSSLPAQSVPGYTTADVRLGWHAGEHTEFSVVGQNLLQPRHEEFNGEPTTIVSIKRCVYAKITWQR